MKLPKDSPTKVGQRVTLRGRGATGTVKKIWHPLKGRDLIWVKVAWDQTGAGARICGPGELQLLKEPVTCDS